MRAEDSVRFSAARIAGKSRGLKTASRRRSREKREQLRRSPEDAGKYSTGAAVKKSRRANSQSRLRRFESRNNRRSPSDPEERAGGRPGECSRSTGYLFTPGPLPSRVLERAPKMLERAGIGAAVNSRGAQISAKVAADIFAEKVASRRAGGFAPSRFDGEDSRPSRLGKPKSCA